MVTHSSTLVWKIPWMDGGAWWATVHGVAKSRTRLSDFTPLSCTVWASLVARVVKSLPAKAGDIRDTGSITGVGRSPGGGHGNLLQCSCLKNPRDRGVWRAKVHVTQSWTQLKQPNRHAHPCSIHQLSRLAHACTIHPMLKLMVFTVSVPPSLLFRFLPVSPCVSSHRHSIDKWDNGRGCLPSPPHAGS